MSKIKTISMLVHTEVNYFQAVRTQPVSRSTSMKRGLQPVTPARYDEYGFKPWILRLNW